MRDDTIGKRREFGRAVRFFAVLLLLLAAPSALAQDVSLRAVLSEQRFSTDAFSTEAFHQLYDLRLQRQLTVPLRFRLFGRVELANGMSDIGGFRTKQRFLQIQPGGEFFYSLPKLQIQGLYDLIDTRSKSNDLAESHRILERTTATLSYRPDDLPGLAIQAQRRIAKDPASQLDQKETLLNGTLDYTVGGLHLAATGRSTRLDDGQLGFARKSEEVQGQASYERSFLRGRGNVAANALVSSSRLDERAGGRAAVSVATPLTIAHALASIDDTPLDSRDKPPVETPALIDGNLTEVTSIDVGPDGSTYQNLVIDLGRFAALDTVRVVVRDGGGNLVPSGGPVVFNVYTSQDGIPWTPLPGGVRTQFIIPLSLWEATFGETTTRFLKVVSFHLAPTDARVTELQAFVHTSFLASETRRTAVLLASGTANASVKPFSTLTLGYYGSFNTISQKAQERADVSTADTDQLVSATWDATRRLNVLGRYQWRNVSATGGFSQAYRATTADVRYGLLRNLDITLEGFQNAQDESGVKSQTSGGSFRTYMRFFRTLDLALDLGVQRQEYTADGRVATRTTLSGYSSSQLSSALRLRLEASIQRSRYENFDTENLATRDERYAADFFYRPSQQLGLGARIGYVRSTLFSGVIQSYRVDFLPFPYGALRVGGRFDQDVEPFTKRTSQRLMATAGWTMNKHTIFDVNYTIQTVTGIPRTTAFYTTLSVQF